MRRRLVAVCERYARGRGGGPHSRAQLEQRAPRELRGRGLCDAAQRREQRKGRGPHGRGHARREAGVADDAPRARARSRRARPARRKERQVARRPRGRGAARERAAGHGVRRAAALVVARADGVARARRLRVRARDGRPQAVERLVVAGGRRREHARDGGLEVRRGREAPGGSERARGDGHGGGPRGRDELAHRHGAQHGARERGARRRVGLSVVGGRLVRQTFAPSHRAPRTDRG